MVGSESDGAPAKRTPPIHESGGQTVIHFLENQSVILYALRGSYEPSLVALSYAIAVLATYSGLSISERVAATAGRARQAWLASGALVMGIGVWAMHFTGMLAFALPVPASYDLGWTAASAIPAILASALGLHIMAQRSRHHRRLLIGGVLIGAGIGAMHYVGMAAMILPAEHQYSPGLFALSILVAVALGIAALYVHDLRREITWHGGRLQLPLAAAIFGLAITGMHYTAMAAVHFIPIEDGAVVAPGLAASTLGIAVAVITVVFIGLAIVASRVGKEFQDTARRIRIDRHRMTDALDSITDGFILFDDEGRLVMCNRVFQEMYPGLAEVLKPGTAYERVIRSWAGMRSRRPGDANTEAYVAECLRRFKEGSGDQPEEDQLQDGRWIYVRQRTVDGGGLVGVWTDVTPIKKLQSLYERQATHDGLTGLANRQLFSDRVDHAIAHARRLKRTLPLLFVDLDDFKPVNDALGHLAGDLVLQEVARRLKEAVRETDTLARVGGDEFVVLMEPYGERAWAEALAARILESLAKPFFAAGKECRIGASIGIGILSPENADADALVNIADEAMYEAKRAGGNRMIVHAA